MLPVRENLEYDPQLGIHWTATCAQNPHKTSRNFLFGRWLSVPQSEHTRTRIIAVLKEAQAQTPGCGR